MYSSIRIFCLLCLAFVLCLISVGCSTKGSACESDLGCARGEICEANECKEGCRADAECSNGLFCLNDKCGDKRCNPGSKQGCFDGPLRMVGVGACRYGVQFCTTKGQWSQCSGQIGSQAETCDRVDNDCNGKIDDGLDCQCKPGIERQCYTGPKETRGGNKPCKAGIQTCLVDNRWGPCFDQRLPLPEECGINDNDCDGRVDNGLDCKCTAGSKRECYTGPPNTNGVGTCKSGEQTCGQNEKWSECRNQTTPVRETCDLLDNNCNGLIDDLPDGSSCEQRKPFSPILLSNATINALSFDASGDVIIAGLFTNKLKWGTKTVVGTGPTNAFVAKYNNALNQADWLIYGYGSNAQGFTDVHTTPDGSIFVSGFTSSPSMKLAGAKNKTKELIGKGKRSLLIKLNSTGKIDGVIEPVTSQGNNNEGLRLASDNKLVYLLGNFQGVIAFGPEIKSSPNKSAYLAAFSLQNLQSSWTAVLKSSNGRVTPTAIAASTIDANTRIVVGGLFNGDINSPNINAKHPSSTSFLASYDAKGNNQALLAMECDDGCRVNQLRWRNGRLFGIGSFSGSIKTANNRPKAGANSQIFVAEFDETLNKESLIQSLFVPTTTEATAANEGRAIVPLSKHTFIAVQLTHRTKWNDKILATSGQREIVIAQFESPPNLLHFALSQGSEDSRFALSDMIANEKKEIYYVGTVQGTLSIDGKTLIKNVKTPLAIFGKLTFPQ